MPDPLDAFDPRHITTYPDADIEAIACAARAARQAVVATAHAARPATTTAQLADIAREHIERAGAEPIFLGYQQGDATPPYPAAACICINDEVVHAVPGPRPLESGDLVTIDLGLRLDGWCADTAHSFIVDDDRASRGVPPRQDAAAPSTGPATLLHALNHSIDTALAMMAPGTPWSTIARALEQIAIDAGCGWVTQYVGHGIGRRLHEAPRAPAFWTAFDAPDFTLREGMVLAIEPILTRSEPPTPAPTPVALDHDRWTVRTADGSIAAHEEHMVAITASGPRILTTESQF